MISREQSVDRDEIALSQIKVAQRNWLKSLIMGILITAVCLAITFTVDSYQPMSFLIIPLGVIASTFLGTIVFLIGTFLSSK